MTPEISFHAITGAEHPQTIRVLGKLQNKSLIVLIDGGSTHNFIDQAIATRFGLPIVKDRKLQVVVANRERVECAGHCQGIMLSIQGITITTDYYVLPVAACQVVLGVQWLETLGPVETDYKQLTMTFRIGGVRHTLQGLGREAEASSIEVLHNKECSGLQMWGSSFKFNHLKTCFQQIHTLQRSNVSWRSLQRSSPLTPVSLLNANMTIRFHSSLAQVQ